MKSTDDTRSTNQTTPTSAVRVTNVPQPAINVLHKASGMLTVLVSASSAVATYWHALGLDQYSTAEHSFQ